MPSARHVFPIRKTKLDEETHSVNGMTVKVHSYAKEYKCEFALFRILLGLDTTYKRRFVRVETPEYFMSEVKPEVSYEEQKEELFDQVRSEMQKERELKDAVK